jgi:hypothetical protein
MAFSELLNGKTGVKRDKLRKQWPLKDIFEGQSLWKSSIQTELVAEEVKKEKSE